VMICRECGARVELRSRFEASCIECGSEDLEVEDAYDPQEHELKCEFCGFEVDTTTRDEDWIGEGEEMPSSVDDPCPRCEGALVPRVEAKTPREIPEYKLAREAAKKLHREHGIPGPPYQLEGLAQKLGVAVEVGPFTHEGLLVGNSIEVPAGLSESARRFSLAHELGHYVLRHQGERKTVEPEANAFASELLIPRAELKAAIAQNSSMRALATEFGVSRQVVAYAVMSAKALGRVSR
jgi:uncharacterized protein DUF955